MWLEVNKWLKEKGGTAEKAERRNGGKG